MVVVLLAILSKRQDGLNIYRKRLEFVRRSVSHRIDGVFERGKTN
jgi:hypothetical protein